MFFKIIVVVVVFIINVFCSMVVSAFPGHSKWSFTVNNEGNCHFFNAHSALFANSTIHMQISCDMPISSRDQNKINVGLVVRSSPCFEEYFGSEYWVMADYFSWYYHCPQSLFGDYGYKNVTYFKTDELKFDCNHLVDLKSLIDNGKFLTESVDSTNSRSCQSDDKLCDSSSTIRHISESANTHQIKNGHSITVPYDGNYLLILFIRFDNSDDDDDQQYRSNLTVDINFESNSGQYLSAVDYPLLKFYGFMSCLYFIFALTWFIVSLIRWQELLKIQFFIAAIIFLGMVEKAIFFGVYQSVNRTGILNHNIFYLAELFSCIKRTLARVLLIIVSSGFEIIRPHLGSNRNKIITIGLFYFILGTFDSTIRIFKPKNDLTNGNLFSEIPLSLLDSIISWWIFSNLVQTTKILRLRRNCIKLDLFNYLTNVLVFSVLASVAFMIWQIHNHKLTSCLSTWKYLWIDEAYWHILFSIILVAIMILWRPSNNNQRYAFTSLLMDESQEELINKNQSNIMIENSTNGEMKMRFHKSSNNHHETEDIISQETADHLKWIENNIQTTTLIDASMPSLMDSDEELINTKFEMSKIQ
ncbi:transmembrane protein 87A isoform X1 [Dermatophagoides pteronyssinus]|uniref:transmembrane protein 87A isoform X1 n=1 Tax=Dermatophagoides pteronyssinus TaxID=6956 RepID=UPI003F675B15